MKRQFRSAIQTDGYVTQHGHAATRRRAFSTQFLFTVAIMSLTQSLFAADSGQFRVYFGTYTDNHSQGIYTARFDARSGTLTPAELAAEMRNPSFVAIHPNRKYLYAVSEIDEFQGKSSGSVSAFSIDSATGKLTALNEQPSAGRAPCHLIVDSAGKNVLVANYNGGSVAVLPIGSNGKLSLPSTVVQHRGKSVNPERQGGPHAHSINLDRANRFAFAADLGLDKVLIYQFDGRRGTLTANDPAAGVVAPGGGPRHFAFHPSEKFAFVNNELTSTVTSFAYDAAKGSLVEIMTVSTLPQPTPGNSTAETVVHPSGKFVYVSNRGHDSIAMFACDDSGRLKAIGHHPSGGKTPRNFNIDPTGQYLLAANQDSNDVFVLKIDQATGELAATGKSIAVGRPVCVRFLTLEQ